MTLPPGQRAVEGFPHFGFGLGGPAPRVPLVPAIEVAGHLPVAITRPLNHVLAMPIRFLCARGPK